MANQNVPTYHTTAPQPKIHEERDFLHDVGVSLNAALFIIDRLIEEIKEEEGRLEIDVETEKLFHHLATYLAKIDRLVKDRRTHLSEILDEEMRHEKIREKQKTATQ
ncbi:hypothetical protein [Bdellovibrio svalbardensis]|uniref:Uncharacterized protein n=1 Tax=Bdellovibrio svalbardensis TaxID=2972972 RepID=A0ABT6DJC6_9BACT|nr:hypothetical protein [Bdellovibrio svalbardensis]MDG0816609.1 hypothetical protein [Bdellovibrio svalbardensis]